MATPISEIKKLLEEGRIIIGLSAALKNLKKGIVKKVFLASNCSAKMIDDVSSLCSVSKIEVVRLSIPNDELGAICKKPFLVSVLSVNNG